MLKDRYDNPLTTSSQQARDLYIIAVDSFLSGGPDMVREFEQVVETDPGFAMGHVGLARAQHLNAQGGLAKETMVRACELADGVTSQEAAHIHATDLLISGKIPKAYPLIREHVTTYPRDVLLAQPCTGVFGLIGFSGQPGREAECLAYTTSLAPHYGEDWWFLSQHAFALCETGQIDRASEMIDRSLALNPLNSHGAHVRSHVDYEAGETQTGIDYLKNWLKDFDKRGMMHCHLSWHVALWALGQGDVDLMWETIDRDIVPQASQGLPINVITDNASILYRAELAGVAVDAKRWEAVSTYATSFFPKTSLGFVDIHAALAHAMAGNSEELERIISNPRGPSADLVETFSSAFKAIAASDWKDAQSHLANALTDHARIGGSRAQRDMLDYMLLQTLLKQGLGDEAKRLLSLRRPVQASGAPVFGLHH